MLDIRNWASKLLLASFFVLYCASGAHAAIPGSASSDARFRHGYLVCNYYSGVAEDGTGDSTSGLNTCIADAWDNQAAAYLECGTYLVTNTIKLYEWVPWNAATGRSAGENLRAHTLRGEHNCSGGARPTIKVKDASSNFTNVNALRPVVAFRSFEAKNGSAVVGTEPANAFDLPNANWQDGGSVYFYNAIENINIDTNDHAGAVALIMPGGQDNGIYNVKITATGSYAGIADLPGRNGVVANVEIVGGQFGIKLGDYGNLGGLNPQQGTTFAGLTLSGQTVRSMLLADAVAPVVVGFDMTKTSDGPAIESDSDGGLVLVDGKIAMSGAAANDVVIDNTVGKSIYIRETFISGSNQLIRNVSAIVPPNGSPPWARIQQYVYTNQYNQDGSTTASVFPTYPGGSSQFEARSVIDGQLSGGPTPISQIVSGTPPTDIVSRHVWTSMPSVDDGPCTSPLDYGPAAYINAGDIPGTTTGSNDHTSAWNQAIAASVNAPYNNRVCVPRGTTLITGTLDLNANTKLIGAGMRKSAIAFKDSWNPSAPVPMIRTADSASGATYGGFFTVLIKTQPTSEDWMYHFRWRTGKSSMLVAVDMSAPFLALCNGATSLPANHQRYAFWVSNNGGGRFYTIQVGNPSNLARHTDTALIFLDGNTQPASFYGNNLEPGKTGNCGIPDHAMFIDGTTAGVRSYGTKREGKSGTFHVNASKNVGLFGMGAMVEGLKPASQAYYKITGTSTNTNNIVIGNTTVRSNPGNPPPASYPLIRQELTGLTTVNTVQWPTGLSAYILGTLDDAPFTTSGVPSPTAPDVRSTEVNVINRVDVCWNIYDSTSLSPASSATGFTVTVTPSGGGGAVSKVPTSVVLQGTDCYFLFFDPATITVNTQVITVAYQLGNIAGVGPGTPAALAFTAQTATNHLSPTPSPVLEQTAFFFRTLSGLIDLACSVPYLTSGESYENVAANFIKGGKFRVHMKVADNTADAPPQAFFVCYQKNETGAYALLPNICAAGGTCFTDTPDVGDGTPTVEILTPTETTFVPGAFLKNADTQVVINLPNNSETGIEAAVRIDEAASVGDRFRYRVCRSGGADLDSYAQIPLVTVLSKRASRRGGVSR